MSNTVQLMFPRFLAFVSEDLPRLAKEFYHDLRNPREAELRKKAEAFFQLTFALLGAITKADGVVDERETSFVERYVESVFSLSPDRRDFAISIYRKALEDTLKPELYARGLYSMFRGSLLLEVLLELMVEVAAVDGHIADSEDELLWLVAREFGISNKKYKAFKKGVLRSHEISLLEQCVDVLDLKSTDGLTEVELQYAYKKRLERYDIEFLRAEGMPEEFSLFVQKKAGTVEESYFTLKQWFLAERAKEIEG